jgi:threonine dehydratase
MPRNDTSGEIPLDLVERVRRAAAAYTRRTPLIASDWLSEASGCEVLLKCENLQVTGSFKARGAFAAITELSAAERASGVITSSAGNHGQGLALAARRFGVPCTVVVPSSIPAIKEAAIRAHGARVLRSPHGGYDRTQAWTLERLEELGGVFISPFEHPAVIAGNGGALAWEVFDEAPGIDLLVIPCGGGGCAIGAGVAARALSPRTRILAVNSDASPAMWRSRRDGRPHLAIESRPTIAEGIEGGVSETSYRLAERYVDEVVACREETIRRAVADVLRQDHLLIEGAAAAGVAAVLEGKARAPRVALVLTGGNIDPGLLRELLAEQRA